MKIQSFSSLLLFGNHPIVYLQWGVMLWLCTGCDAADRNKAPRFSADTIRLERTNPKEAIQFTDHVFEWDATPLPDNPDLFHSSRLDSLLCTHNEIYFLPDIIGTAFPDYEVSVVTCRNLHKTVLLFYDTQRILRDTLTMHTEKTFSLNAILESGDRGVCVGEYSETSNYMNIQHLYTLNTSLKLKEVETGKIKNCPLPQELLSEENPELSETFVFGTKK